MWRVTAGIEVRSSCGGRGTCPFFDVDAGYQHQTWGSDPSEAETHRGPLAGARAGLELGLEHLRLRAAFELYEYRREFVGHESPKWQTGGGPSFTIGYRF
jgi:hypothetical protein